MKTGRKSHNISHQEVRIMNTNEFFPNIPKIKYKGPDSKDPFSFRFYDPEEKDHA